jgi:hypothetical protein
MSQQIDFQTVEEIRIKIIHIDDKFIDIRFDYNQIG